MTSEQKDSYWKELIGIIRFFLALERAGLNPRYDCDRAFDARILAERIIRNGHSFYRV